MYKKILEKIVALTKTSTSNIKCEIFMLYENTNNSKYGSLNTTSECIGKIKSKIELLTKTKPESYTQKKYSYYDLELNIFTKDNIKEKEKEYLKKEQMYNNFVVSENSNCSFMIIGTLETNIDSSIFPIIEKYHKETSLEITTYTIEYIKIYITKEKDKYSINLMFSTQDYKNDNKQNMLEKIINIFVKTF
jgi:hypothetical protein